MLKWCKNIFYIVYEQAKKHSTKSFPIQFLENKIHLSSGAYEEINLKRKVMAMITNCNFEIIIKCIIVYLNKKTTNTNRSLTILSMTDRL